MISNVSTAHALLPVIPNIGTAPQAGAEPTEHLTSPVDTFTPSSQLQGESAVASNQMGWDQIETNTKRAQQLYEHKKYQEASDLSQRTIEGAESWKNFGSQDATDQTMTKEALHKQIDLAGIQEKSARKLGHHDQADQFDVMQKYYQQQLQSL